MSKGRDKSVWLCTPKGDLVKMYYDFKKSLSSHILEVAYQSLENGDGILKKETREQKNK